MSSKTNVNNDNSNDNKMSQFLNNKYINIETYEKNGQAVRTPVWFIVDNSKIYSSNNPHVRVAPYDARGRPRDKWVDGEIRIANSSESEQANRLLNQKYGLQGRLVRTFNKLRKTRPIVICVEI
ncbi:MAG: PPOX class F420-dependent oxidoreductase [Nitrososphaeraceae archaeon]